MKHWFFVWGAKGAEGVRELPRCAEGAEDSTYALSKRVKFLEEDGTKKTKEYPKGIMMHDSNLSWGTRCETASRFRPVARAETLQERRALWCVLALQSLQMNPPETRSERVHNVRGRQALQHIKYAKCLQDRQALGCVLSLQSKSAEHRSSRRPVQRAIIAD